MMGSPSNENTLYIGEIEFERGSPNLALLSCYLPDDSTLSIIIQNEFGRIQFEKQIYVEAGDNVIELDLSSLDGGKYYAWIDLFGQTFIRNIIIENSDHSSNKWIKKVRDLFRR